jgi:hypothetical protein
VVFQTAAVPVWWCLVLGARCHQALCRGACLPRASRPLREEAAVFRPRRARPERSEGGSGGTGSPSGVQGRSPWRRIAPRFSLSLYVASSSGLRHVSAYRRGLVGKAVLGGFSHDADKACLRAVASCASEHVQARASGFVFTPRRLSPSPAASTPAPPPSPPRERAAASRPRRACPERSEGGSGGTGSPSGVQGRSPWGGHRPTVRLCICLSPSPPLCGTIRSRFRLLGL